MGGAVVQRFVVNLIGKDDELVLARDLNNAAQQVVGVERARRVVGVDDNDGFGVERDLGADIVEVG